MNFSFYKNFPNFFVLWVWIWYTIRLQVFRTRPYSQIWKEGKARFLLNFSMTTADSINALRSYESWGIFFPDAAFRKKLSRFVTAGHRKLKFRYDVATDVAYTSEPSHLKSLETRFLANFFFFFVKGCVLRHSLRCGAHLSWPIEGSIWNIKRPRVLRRRPHHQIWETRKTGFLAIFFSFFSFFFFFFFFFFF